MPQFALRQEPQQELRADQDGKQATPVAAQFLTAALEALPQAALLSDCTAAIRGASQAFVRLFELGDSPAHFPESLVELAAAIEARAADSALELGELLRIWRAPFAEGSAPAELCFTIRGRRIIRRAIDLRAGSGELLGRLELFETVRAAQPDFASRLQTEKLAAIGQLVSGIAHELNNPLTSIRGYAQLLLARTRPRDRMAHAEQIYREAERAGRIVQNLLLFARKARAVRKPVDLNEVIERTLALRAYELRLENIEVELDLESGLPAAMGDSDQLQQVILNLLVNAEQAILHSAEQPTRQNGALRRIRIRTSSRPGAMGHRPPVPRRGRLAIEISDSGPGIRPQVHEHLFEPFFTTKPAGAGTGLGLSIVFGIVQEHGGKIYALNHLENSPGAGDTQLGGARFVVELPVAHIPVGRAERRSETRIVRRVKQGPHEVAGRRVLVVEDERPVAELIRDVLRQDGLYVETVTDSQEGLARALSGSYDLILCDLRMPPPDGAEFHRVLEAAARGAHRRLAFVTGDTLSRSSVNFLKRAGLPYLAKPFFVEDLRHFVFNILRSTVRARKGQQGTVRTVPTSARRR
jgi:signal transduction histidine kinase/FixJ family two-component response regulator